MSSFQVVCINDSDKPDGIPMSRWIKKGITYTVIEVAKLRMQGGMLGYKLEEINIDDCFPYQFFSANRFALLVTPSQLWAEQTLKKLLEEAKKEAEEEIQVL
jgi:hypothetical protein